MLQEEPQLATVSAKEYSTYVTMIELSDKSTCRQPPKGSTTELFFSMRSRYAQEKQQLHKVITSGIGYHKLTK